MSLKSYGTSFERFISVWSQKIKILVGLLSCYLSIGSDAVLLHKWPKKRVFLKGTVSGANYVLKHWTVYNGMYVNDTRTDRYYGRNSVLRCLDMKRCSLKLLFLPAFIHSKLLRTYNVKVSWPTFEIFHSHKNLNEKYWFDFKVVQLSYTEISIILWTKCVWIRLNSNGQKRMKTNRKVFWVKMSQ